MWNLVAQVGASGPVGIGILLGEHGRRILACRGSQSPSPSNGILFCCPGDCGVLLGSLSTVPRIRLIMGVQEQVKQWVGHTQSIGTETLGWEVGSLSPFLSPSGVW